MRILENETDKLEFINDEFAIYSFIENEKKYFGGIVLKHDFELLGDLGVVCETMEEIQYIFDVNYKYKKIKKLFK